MVEIFTYITVRKKNIFVKSCVICTNNYLTANTNSSIFMYAIYFPMICLPNMNENIELDKQWFMKIKNMYKTY